MAKDKEQTESTKPKQDEAKPDHGNKAKSPDRAPAKAPRRNRSRSLPRREGVRRVHDVPATPEQVKKAAKDSADELEKRQKEQRKRREAHLPLHERRAEDRARLTGDDRAYPRT